MFFVLSGFLITALLLEEHFRNGRIGLHFFYGRRARRLLPALFLALCLVGVAGILRPNMDDGHRLSVVNIGSRGICWKLG